MQAGKLRTRISVERAPEIRTTTGASRLDWDHAFVVARASAEVLNQSGREFSAARQMTPELTQIFRVHYPLDATVNDRIDMNGHKFDILSIINVGKRNRELRIECKEGLRQGA